MSTDRLDAFSLAWCDRWAVELAASTAYRSAAAEWEGAVVLRLDVDGPLRAAWADLNHGDCRECRPAAPDDLEEAPFVLTTDLDTWRALFAGQLDPMWALMGHRIRLDRGQLGKLIPFATAAKEMVAAARRVPTRFGDEPQTADEPKASAPVPTASPAATASTSRRPGTTTRPSGR